MRDGDTSPSTSNNLPTKLNSITTFVVFMPIWMSSLWLDRIMMLWFVLSLKSLIAAISQSSVSLTLVALNRGCRTILLVPRVWLWCYGRIPFLPAEQVWVFLPWILCVSYLQSNKQFLCFPFNHNPGNDGSRYNCLLDSMARGQQLMIEQSALLVMPMLITLSGWFAVPAVGSLSHSHCW